MADDTNAFNVVVNEIHPSRLLLSDGHAMFVDNSTHATQSFVLQPGHAQVDFHKHSGHIRISRGGTSIESGLVFRIVPNGSETCPVEPTVECNELPVCVKSCLASLRKYFKQQESADSEYHSSVPLQTRTLLPHRPLQLATTPSPKSEWLVARVTDFALGKPSAAFQVVALASTFSASSTPNPCIRLRLYSSFTKFQAKLWAENPKIPTLPSNWRADQRVLQRELNAWLYDVTRLLEPKNRSLIAFFEDPSDDFQPQDISSSSLFFSLAHAVMGKSYVPLFPTPLSPFSPSQSLGLSTSQSAKLASSTNRNTPSSSTLTIRTADELENAAANVSSMLAMLNSGSKPVTLLVGASGSSKSSFINHIVGFPVCDPMGASLSAKSLVATFYEVIPPADFADLARSASYWTHPSQFHLASYSKDGSFSGSQSILVDLEKLQEPIHRLETSWKRGFSIHLLDHQQTLDRFYVRIGASPSSIPSTYGTILYRTCLINEASLDPIRQEYEIARNNIFVELNNFNLENALLQQPASLLPSTLASSFAAASASHPSSGLHDLSSDLKSILQDTSSMSSSASASPTQTPGNFTCLVENDPRIISQLLELSILRQYCHHLLYFVSFDRLEKCVEENVLLEISELLCMSKDSYQFSQTLTTWIQQCTTYENKLDLLKLLGLMKHWTSLLPSPRRNRDILFLSPEILPDTSLRQVCAKFKIHEILETTGYVLLTKDSAESTLSNAQSTSLSASKLSVSLSPSTTHVSTPVFAYIVDTDAKSALFDKFMVRPLQQPQP